jgi:hypothetical protein
MANIEPHIIDYEHADANMYGCQPCPHCGSTKRATWPGKSQDSYRIECDDCGFKQEGTLSREVNS